MAGVASRLGGSALVAGNEDEEEDEEVGRERATAVCDIFCIFVGGGPDELSWLDRFWEANVDLGPARLLESAPLLRLLR